MDYVQTAGDQIRRILEYGIYNDSIKAAQSAVRVHASAYEGLNLSDKDRLDLKFGAALQDLSRSLGKRITEADLP